MMDRAVPAIAAGATTAAFVEGHVDLADWMFLIGAVCAAIAALLMLTARPDPSRGALIPTALALVAIGLLVL